MSLAAQAVNALGRRLRAVLLEEAESGVAFALFARRARLADGEPT